ncbi:MAG: hypothetical protein AABW82_00390 [Nanoarchaeota archaeon]
MKKLVIAIILIIVLVVGGFALKSFVSVDEDVNDNNTEVYCQSDSDCVPLGACHPKTCINKAYPQDTSGGICTAVCEPDSLDCGQGSCLCVNNKCNAVFNE